MTNCEIKLGVVKNKDGSRSFGLPASRMCETNLFIIGQAGAGKAHFDKELLKKILASVESLLIFDAQIDVQSLF